MKTHSINLKDFSDEHPKEEGQFLWLNSLGVELITVYREEEKVAWGMKWDSYLAVAGCRGRNVEKLQGKFLKLNIDNQ